MKQIKLIALLATTVAVLFGYGLVAWKFYNIGKTACEHKVLEQGAKDEKKYEDTKQKVMSLDDVALRHEFCKWVRDDRDLCLKADIPISE